MNSSHRIIGLVLLMAAGVGAIAGLARAEYTTHVEGSGLSSTDGNATKSPFDVVPTDNPNGSKSLAASGYAQRQTIGAGAQITAYAGGEVMTSSSAGTIRARLSTSAYTVDELFHAPRVTASVGASFVDTVTLIAAAGSGLVAGDPVNYQVRWVVDGVTNSPYYYSGFHYPLGRLSASFSVYDGEQFKAGTGFALPPYEGYTINALWDLDIPYVVTGVVGATLKVSAGLGLSSDNRSGLVLDGSSTTYGDQSTLLDFSNTMHVYLDPVTPGLGFSAESTHDYTFSAVPAVPLLSIERTGDQVLISWPETAQGFSLESTTDLASPDWQVRPTILNRLTTPITSPQEFFRLVKK